MAANTALWELFSHVTLRLSVCLHVPTCRPHPECRSSSPTTFYSIAILYSARRPRPTCHHGRVIVSRHRQLVSVYLCPCHGHYLSPTTPQPSTTIRHMDYVPKHQPKKHRSGPPPKDRQPDTRNTTKRRLRSEHGKFNLPKSRNSQHTATPLVDMPRI